MDALTLSLIFSILFWILAAYKQYKTELFYFFFIIAITDPINSLVMLLISRDYITVVYTIFSFLALLMVCKPKLKNRITILIYFSLVVIGIIILLYPIGFLRHFFALIHLIILLFFIKRAFAFVAEVGKMNIFHAILILYETTLVTKIFAIIINSKTGYWYFIVTNFFQTVLAIFFVLYKETDKKLLIDLKNR